jgi:hypothetical protein
MTMNPYLKRYADRIQELIREGKAVASLEKPSEVGPYIQGEDKIALQSWLGKVSNIVVSTFGPDSPQSRHFHQNLPEGGAGVVAHAYEVHAIIGVLDAALSDLEGGYLAGQELLIAGDLFDSILEQAKHLNSNGHKDPAAVLARVVVEDTLKRLARAANLDDNRRASQLNDDLKAAGKYPQPQWRLIQSWLDVGNAAAHGKFAEYDKAAVSNMLDGIEQFLAVALKS